MITTHTVVPFLIAMIVAVAGMPTNVYQICRRSVGTLEIEPWLQRSTAAMARAVSASTAWRIRLLRLLAPATCTAAVLLALMASDLSASDATVVTAITVPALTAMSLEELQTKRAQLLSEAEALRGADGAFADDKTRETFDAKMAEIETIDAQLRARAANPSANADREAGVQAERARIKSINDAVRIAGLEPTVAEDFAARNLTIDQARAEIFTKLAEKQKTNPTNNIRAEFGEDARDKWVRGAGNWLMVRSGMASMVAKHEGVELRTIEPGEFRGMSLLDLARESLTRAGQTVRGLDKMALAGLAMAYRSNYQTTSDFATVLENALHKVLRAAYAITPDTWSRWCGTGTVSDFRAHNWYRMGSLTELESLNEVGEFKNKSIPDAEKASFSAATKGNIIAISRQTIVNDDVGFVMRLTSMLGRAGKLTIEKAVYSKLGENSGLGPNQSDSNPLFHSSRNNISTGAALSAAAIDADRVQMAQQKDVNGVDFLDLRPAILLLPVGLGGQARVINDSQYDPDTVANKSQMKPNIVQGLFRDVVDTPRLSGTRRYLFADPTLAPVILVSFLEGQTEPVLETQDGWRVDGVELRARLDFGVDSVDFRGAVTNAGA